MSPHEAQLELIARPADADENGGARRSEDRVFHITDSASKHRHVVNVEDFVVLLQQVGALRGAAGNELRDEHAALVGAEAPWVHRALAAHVRDSREA